MKKILSILALLSLAGCGGQSNLKPGCNPVPIANAGEAQTVIIGLNLPQSVQLGTPGIPGTSYLWEPSEGLSDPFVAQPVASPSKSMIYVLTASNECGFVRSQVPVSVYAEEK